MKTKRQSSSQNVGEPLVGAVTSYTRTAPVTSGAGPVMKSRTQRGEAHLEKLTVATTSTRIPRTYYRTHMGPPLFPARNPISRAVGSILVFISP
jgi:hypothetical protein